MNLHDPDHYVFLRNSRLPRDTFKRRTNFEERWIQSGRLIFWISVAVLVWALVPFAHV